MASAPPPLAKSHHRILPGIQYLRGWAAAMVVVAHVDAMMLFPKYFSMRPLDVELIGSYGVALFFCISGFIIASVSLDAELGNRITIPTYAKRRFERIVPFLWVCVLGYAAIHLVFGHEPFDPAKMLRALFLWPVGEMRPNVVWSLRHELIFYLLFAATVLTAKRRVWLLAAWCLAPLVAYPLEPYVARALGPDHPGLHELYRNVLCGSNAGANLQFGAGLLIAVGYLRGAPLLRQRVPFGPLLCLGAAALAAFATDRLHLPFGLAKGVVWTLLSAPVLMLAVAIVPPSKGLLHRVGLLLGNASFSIYLTHNPVLLFLLEAGSRIRDLSPWVFLPAAIVLALLGGVIVHLVVERPLLRLMGLRRVLVAAESAKSLSERTG